MGYEVVGGAKTHIFHDGAVWVERSGPTDNEGLGRGGGVHFWDRVVEPDVIATRVVLCIVGGEWGGGGVRIESCDKTTHCTSNSFPFIF